MMQTLPFCVALGLTACVKPGGGGVGGGRSVHSDKVIDCILRWL